MRYNQRALLLIIPSLLTLAVESAVAKDVKTLEINAPAPKLNLPGVDDKTYRLADFADAKVLVVIFTCNHCPTAQAYEQRIIQLHADYHDKGVPPQSNVACLSAVREEASIHRKQKVVFSI